MPKPSVMANDYALVYWDPALSNPKVNVQVFQFYQNQKKVLLGSTEAFITYKNEEAKLERRWEYMLRRKDQLIGILTIVDKFQSSDPVLFVDICIRKSDLDHYVSQMIAEWFADMKHEQKTEKLICYDSNPYIESFLLSHGAKTVNWLYFFELELDKINSELLHDWCRQDLLEQHQLTLQFYDDIPNHLLSQHSQLHTELSNGIRRMDYSWKAEKSTTYTANRQKLLHLKGKRSKLGYLLDKKGKLVGMTKLELDAAKPDSVYQTITGVEESYRTKGLAKFLKAAMIRHLIEKFPQVRLIETDCLKGNTPMMLINEKLGFRRKGTRVEKEFII